MKLKDVLHKGNRIKDFFMANSFSNSNFEDFLESRFFHEHLSEGRCLTFLQYVLQSDDSTVKLVYKHFMEYLVCTHNNNNSDCWQCSEKQNVLELALYYHFFEIADKLIAMNAYYTHVSLCNAARHGDLRRVQTIVEDLKRSQVFDPDCTEAKQALCRAYLSRSQDVIEILLQEGITLDSIHLVDVVKHGDINVLMKVVEHLKFHSKWHKLWAFDCISGCFFDPDMYSDQTAYISFPNRYAGSTALYIAYCNEKLDMADYLLQNEAKLSMEMLATVVENSSKKAVDRVIQHLKVTRIWDPHCEDASRALAEAFGAQKYDICNMLVQEGVLMTVKNLDCMVGKFKISLEAVKKALKYLKDTENWDPKGDDASIALLIAFVYKKYDVCDLLVQEGVSITMKHVPHVILRPLDYVKTVVKQLKDTDSWDPKCDDASKALTKAYREEKYDVCDLLIQDGVSLTMKNLPMVVDGFEISLEAVKKTVQHLKDTKNWDLKCKDALNAFEKAYRKKKYDVCNLLIQEGVLLTMKNLLHMLMKTEISLESVKKTVQHLKDTKNWDPNCKDASKALDFAYKFYNYDVCDLLIHEGVPITMKHVPHAVLRSLDYVKTVVKQLKDAHSWDPKCDDASEALAKAFVRKKYDVCDLLIHEGVPITMKHVPHAVLRSLDYVKTVVKQLKDTDSWDPKCDDASKALTEAYREKNYDVCDLLIQDGVSLTMKNLPVVISEFEISLEVVKKAVKHLKDTKNWDLNCEDASNALEIACGEKKYDVCNLLIHEGVPITLKQHTILRSLDYVKTVVKQLKYSNSWDPKCDDAVEALINAYREKKYDVCNLLIQEGVSLTMKNLLHMFMETEISLEAVKKTVQHLKDTKNWDPNCKDASKALDFAYKFYNYDVCDLLIHEGVPITLKQHAIFRSLDYVKTVVKQLKYSNSWDPKCDAAVEALINAYREKKYDVCDLLIQEGVSLTIKNLPHVVCVFEISLKAVQVAVQHLKDTKNWDPNCEDASKTLDFAYVSHKYDVCNLLSHEGVPITMKHVPYAVLRSLDYVKTVVKQLKDTDSWDLKCDDASEALANVYRQKKYDVCDLLIQEGVSLTMKNLAHVVVGFEILEAVKKAVQHLKDTKNWNPKCRDASNTLEKSFIGEKYDVCILLIQEGCSMTMKNLPGVVGGFRTSWETVTKAVQHLKDINHWDPKCKDASKALEEAYRKQNYDVSDLLIEEGVLLAMKNLLHMVGRLEISSESVKKAVQHLKDTNNWDPKCKDVSEALEEAYGGKKYNVCDLLIQEGVSLTMKCIPNVMLRSLDYAKTVVNQLKDTDSWDPMHDDTSKALEEAYIQQKYDVRDLLIQEGVSLTLKNLPHVVAGLKSSVETVKKAVQDLKDTFNWDPKCNNASKALENAYGEQRYEVCDLLIQEGVSLTMKNVPGVVCRVSLEHVKTAIQHLDKYDVCDLLIQDRVSLIINVVWTFQMPLKTVKKAIEHLKENENWNSKSDEASEALENAYSVQMYGVCDMLLEETVSLTMKNFPGVVGGFEVSCKAVIKAVQHLKATDNWDPKSEYASKALANAYKIQKYDVRDLLIQEGVSLTMQTFDGVVEGFQVSLEAVKKAIQHLKDTDNWVPSCEHASKALENAYVVQKYDVCDLLIQEGVSLSMKNIPGVVYSVSLKYVKKVIQHMNRYDVFDLLVLKRFSLTLKNLPYVVGRSRVSLKAVRKVIQHLKETKNWDPKSEYASIALANAYSAQIYDVCDLLAQEGVLPDNKESSSNGAGISGIIGSS